MYRMTNLLNFFFLPLIRDRFRTTINVMCDALGACIIEHMSKGELDEVTGRELEEAVELAHLRKGDA